MKKIIVVMVAGVVFLFLANSNAKANDINSFVDGLKGVPVKVSTFINKEIEDTKEFQKKGWNDGKIQLVNLKNSILKFFTSN
jgi:hypothetical protein